MAFTWDHMPAEAVKRGRRLITIDAGITSELGGLPAASYARDRNPGVKHFPDCGQQSVARFHASGRKSKDWPDFSSTDPTRTDRGDYTVAAWERAGKKKVEMERRQDHPVGLHQVHHKEIECAPFATSSDANPIPFHRQRRYVNVPGAGAADAEQTYIPKRSRTPPVGVKEHCETEGFTVIYSTNTAEKQRHVAGGVRMIPYEHHGKGTTLTADKIQKRRDQEEAKRDAAFMAHRHYLRQVAERIVAGQHQHISGKKIGAFHPPEREGGPNAMNLPVPTNHIVGKSCARARTPVLTARR